MPRAKGIFEITGWDEKTYETLPNSGKLTEAKVSQKFSGDIEGDGSVIWLMAYTDAKTARYVGIQRVVGSIGGKKGTVLFQTVGAFDGEEANADWSIIPGSGTEQLAGISGTGTFAAPRGSKATYTLDYQFATAGTQPR